MNGNISESLIAQFIEQEAKEIQRQGIRQEVENTVTGMRIGIGRSNILIISVLSNLFSDGKNIIYSFKGPDDKEINLLLSPNIDDDNVLNFKHESNDIFCLLLDYVNDGKNDEITLKFGEKNKTLNFKPVDKQYWMIKIEDENFFDNNEITEVQQYTGDDSFIKKILDYQVVKEIELNIKNIFTEMQKLEEQFKEV